MPGYAVLNEGMGLPIMNPVLATNMSSPPIMLAPIPITIDLRDTPLGNPALPISPVQLLPPISDTSMPQLVPPLVPGLVTTCQPQLTIGVLEDDNESLEELRTRLSLDSDKDLMDLNMTNFVEVFGKYRSILTMKVMKKSRRSSTYMKIDGKKVH